ncbi:hypothetical protein ES332_D02G221000v1 [Gossypium tomentosum]|uniref:Serine-threonine kinase receptor-associated protein n=1 Tax=Gossypium tomentosum TaxID=34277 RepID=A0A5D2M0H0_GOSTO|nr:hypothetical protein ES332_D02G221000v1 [Gossypium tomentosum]
MRPILMKGHERPLTFLKYNRDGDLLFSCAKDHTPTVWFADNGERIGTYRGHNGAVWSCDVSRDSMRLITGSADQTVKLWNVQTGAQLYTFNFGSPARAVWGPLNRTIVSAGEDAVIRIWDSETGKLLREADKESGHKKTITSLTKSADCSHFLTGSLDKSSKLWDTRTLTLIKTYVTERPVNAVAMSPLLDHVRSTVLSYVYMVCATLRHSIPKSIVYCQVREAKRSLLDFFYTELGKLEQKRLSALLNEDPAIMECRSALVKRLELYRSAQAEIDTVAWSK